MGRFEGVHVRIGVQRYARFFISMEKSGRYGQITHPSHQHHLYLQDHRGSAMLGAVMVLYCIIPHPFQAPVQGVQRVCVAFQLHQARYHRGRCVWTLIQVRQQGSGHGPIIRIPGDIVMSELSITCDA